MRAVKYDGYFVCKIFVAEDSMDIYLSVNNRAEVMRLPVIPPSLTISKPEVKEVLKTVSQGEFQLMGVAKLKSITILSVFPV